MGRHEGTCVGGPLNGMVFGCPKDSFWVEHLRVVDALREAIPTRSVYLWRDGVWIWEHYQERDDLPADRN